MTRRPSPHFAPEYKQTFIDAGLKSGKFKMTECGLERRCATCVEYWPADSTFFGIKDGRLDSSCRACLAEKIMTKRRRLRLMRDKNAQKGLI